MFADKTYFHLHFLGLVKIQIYFIFNSVPSSPPLSLALNTKVQKDRTPWLLKLHITDTSKG